MRTVLNFSELLTVISRNYANYGNHAAVEVVRSYYKQVTDVDQLEQMLDWVKGAIIDSPLNGGLHSTYRAILARIDFYSSTK